MSDFYNQYVFDDDKTLFVNHHQIWKEFCTIYQTIRYFYQGNRWKDLISEILKQKTQITRLYMQLQDFGHSHNKEFDDFLNSFTDCISSIDDLHFWIEKETLSTKAKQYQITYKLYKAEIKVKQISHGISEWRDKLHITNQDYHSIDSIQSKHSKFNYIATLPINTEALEVQLKAIPIIHADRTVHIEGITNLFNEANLMLSMKKEEQLFCQAKAIVENKQFVFPQFSDRGKGFVPGLYSGEITLSIQSTQSKEFTKMAGIEYENLTGSFIQRDGIGPHGEYSFTFQIE